MSVHFCISQSINHHLYLFVCFSVFRGFIKTVFRKKKQAMSFLNDIDLFLHLCWSCCTEDDRGAMLATIVPVVTCSCWMVASMVVSICCFWWSTFCSLLRETYVRARKINATSRESNRFDASIISLLQYI